MPSFKPVIALSRGLDILRVVNEERQASVGSLHKATGLDKATIVRMLETLEHEGYVLRDVDRAVYAPTGRALLLSQGYDQHLWIGATEGVDRVDGCRDVVIGVAVARGSQ